MYLLPANDAALISAIALQRLAELFPILNGSLLTITANDVLEIECKDDEHLEAISDSHSLMSFVWVVTGCNSAVLCLNGLSILTRTQLRLIGIAEGTEMAATKTLEKTTKPLFDIERMAKAIAIAIHNELNQEFNHNGEAQLVKIEPPPAAAPAKTAAPVAIRIPRGTFIPAKSNWMQSAKRYLKAVDPKGDGSTVLAAILQQNELGTAHLNKALSYLPKAEREAAREKFYIGFVKVDKERQTKL